MSLENLSSVGRLVVLTATSLVVFLVASCAAGEVLDIDDVQEAVVVDQIEADGVPIVAIPDIVESTIPSIVQIGALRGDGEGNGTGIVYSSDGLIITNWHVVADAQEINVILHDRSVFEAELVRDDPELDIAVLKIDADVLTPAVFGDSNELRVGEEVVAIGHAFGLLGDPSVSKGVVSGLNRVIADGSGNVHTGLIQTDASINLGSSGGALVNARGEVVGINVGLINLGSRANFAVDANSAIQGAERLIALGMRPRPGYLGVGGVAVTPMMASRLALPVNGGFGVRYVDPESPAATVFRIDDVIINIDETPIRNESDFTEFLRRHPQGTDVVVTTVRKEGDVAVLKEIPVTLSAPDA